jgi:prepilin-type N-terminal cleavage/methylation domain-containing protein
MVYYYKNKNRGFTLVELVITLAIIFILFSLFINIFNIKDIFEKTRDTKRINDINFLNNLINNVIIENTDIYLGEENKIYISLPDNSTSCLNYNLPSIKSSYYYQCQNLDDYKKINGNGWIPINFSLFKNIKIDFLPVDPLNNKDFFYSYQIKNKRFKLTAKLENENNLFKMSLDGGNNLTLYEIGSDLNIFSFQSGLIGYWNFDENTGTISYDLSGYNNNGFLNNFDYNSDSGWTKGKIGYGLNFDGINDVVTLNSSLDLNNGFTFLTWIKLSTTVPNNSLTVFNNNQFFLKKNSSTDGNYWVAAVKLNDNTIEPKVQGTIAEGDKWTFLAVTWDKKFLSIFINGKLISKVLREGDLTTNTTTAQIGMGEEMSTSTNPFKGIIDEVYFYNRILSEKEIKYIYQVTK